MAAKRSAAVARERNATPSSGGALIRKLEKLLGAEAWAEFRAGLREPPLVVFMGTTGVGKTTTCNAIFGKDTFKVDPVEPCTTRPQTESMRFADGEITLVDFPGIGDRVERGRACEEAYRRALVEGLPEGGRLRVPSAVVWVFKADQRAHEADERAILALWKKLPAARRERFLFAINQARKMDPIDDWNEAKGIPGPTQARNLERKRTYIARMFKVPRARVVVYSAEEGYNLSGFLDALVECLPSENVPLVVGKAEDVEEARSTRPAGARRRARVITDRSRRKAVDSWWDVLIEKAKKALPAVVVAAAKKVWKHAKPHAAKLWRAIRRWLTSRLPF